MCGGRRETRSLFARALTRGERWKHESTGREEATGRHKVAPSPRERGRAMSPQDVPRRTLEDIERLERVPLARRLAASSTYAVLQKAVTSSPEQPARCLVPLGDPSPQPGEALTARVFLGRVHQTANLLADLGMGPQDVLALLLPDLLEKELLLWGRQAAGIVCPIPPGLPAPEIVDLL